MWEALGVLVAAILAVAASMVAVYLHCDRVLTGFRLAPDPARIPVMIRRVRAMKIANGIFVGCFVLSAILVAVAMKDDAPKDSFKHILASIAGFIFVAIVYFAAALLMGWIRARFGASRTPLPRESLPWSGGGRLPYFVAAQLRPQTDRHGNPEPFDPDDFFTFKIFIARTMLCGASVSDGIDYETGKLTAGSWSTGPWLDSMFYDAFDVTLPGFCRLSGDNFQIAWSDIDGIDCDPKPQSDDVIDASNSGSLTIRLKSGDARALFILEKRDAQALADELRGLAGHRA